MQARYCCCFFVLSALLLLSWTSALWAAGLERLPLRSVTPGAVAVPTKEAASPVIRPAMPGNGAAPATGAADLLLQSAQWSAPPAAGQQLGRNSILNIYVSNAGNVAAPATQLLVICEALEGTPCPAGLINTLNVPPLGPNQGQGMAWPAMSEAVWAAGKYRLVLSLDPQQQVQESNDSNNKMTLNVDIAAPKPAVSALQKVDQVAATASQSSTVAPLPIAGQVGGMQVVPKIAATLSPVDATGQRPAATVYEPRFVLTNMLVAPTWYLDSIVTVSWQKEALPSAAKISIQLEIPPPDERLMYHFNVSQNLANTGSAQFKIERQYFREVKRNGSFGSHYLAPVDTEVILHMVATDAGKSYSVDAKAMLRLPGVKIENPMHGIVWEAGKQYKVTWSQFGTPQPQQVRLRVKKVAQFVAPWEISVPNTESAMIPPQAFTEGVGDYEVSIDHLGEDHFFWDSAVQIELRNP